MTSDAYLLCLGAALAEAGYPEAGIFEINGQVVIGCHPHGSDLSNNPTMPPEALVDRAYKLCEPLRPKGKDSYVPD